MNEKLIEKYRKDKKDIKRSIFLNAIFFLIFSISGMLTEDIVLLFLALVFVSFFVLFAILFVNVCLREELEKLKEQKAR